MIRFSFQDPDQVVVTVVELERVKIAAQDDPFRRVCLLPVIDKLREAGIATSLARPQLMVLSGQRASARVGNGENSSVTEVQLQADALGNNRVFLDLHVERIEPMNGKKNAANAETPQRRSFTNPSLELTLGQTSLLSGWNYKETRTRRGALGRVSEEVRTEAVLLITAEGVMPRQAGVVPATAIAPR